MKNPLLVEKILSRFTYVGKLLYIVFFTTSTAALLSIVQIVIQSKLLTTIQQQQMGSQILYESFILNANLLSANEKEAKSFFQNFYDRVNPILLRFVDKDKEEVHLWQKNSKSWEELWIANKEQPYPWIPMKESPLFQDENRWLVRKILQLDSNFDAQSHQLMNLLANCLPELQNNLWITLAIANLENQGMKQPGDQVAFLAHQQALRGDRDSIKERSQSLLQYNYLFKKNDTSELISQLQTLQTHLNDYVEILSQTGASPAQLNEKGMALQMKLTETAHLVEKTQVTLFEETKSYILFWYVLCIAISIFSFFSTLLVYALRIVRKPLDHLKKSAEELAKGNLSERVPITSNDEVGALSKKFNNMAQFFELIMIDAREITGKLNETTSHIYKTTKQLDANIHTQERSIQEIAANTKNISLSAQNFAKYLQDVYKTASVTSRFAETGQTSLSETEMIMQQMAHSSNNIVEALVNLKEQSILINEVINTNVRLADQSNLLSLNTAIRAGKKGVKGMGFTVVAEKIRELADQTANTTLEIEEVVEEIRDAVADAVTEVDAFSGKVAHLTQEEKTVFAQLREVILHTSVQINTIDEVNLGMQEQARHTQQIHESLSSLAHGAQEATSSVRQLYQEIEFLYHVTCDLQVMINSFSVESSEKPVEKKSPHQQASS